MNLHFRRMYVILQLSSILCFFTMFRHQFCIEFSIASIKHQKERGSKERVPQMAQRCGICERSFKVWSVSKTVLEGSSPSTPAKKRSDAFALLRFLFWRTRTLRGQRAYRKRLIIVFSDADVQTGTARLRAVVKQCRLLCNLPSFYPCHIRNGLNSVFKPFLLIFPLL